ncbi:MAG: zinc-ribbon domain-containing protein [Anaerolineae bacterium]
MIIFGTRHKTKTIGSGEFYCPHCQTQRAYERKHAKRYFALYFIPIVPMGDVGEFIECQTCLHAYNIDVLKYAPPTTPVNAVELLNSVKSRLQAGDPVEYVIRDLTAAGIDRNMATAVVSASIGEDRKFCKTCNLSYVASLESCRECGQLLV